MGRRKIRNFTFKLCILWEYVGTANPINFFFIFLCHVSTLQIPNNLCNIFNLSNISLLPSTASRVNKIQLLEINYYP